MATDATQVGQQPGEAHPDGIRVLSDAGSRLSAVMVVGDDVLATGADRVVVCPDTYLRRLDDVHPMSGATAIPGPTAGLPLLT